ncbi:chaplin [Streptomyces sp. NPDC002133]|uniref:chaplin n=1 Tax=Streptomyces sp. NPDC002133 TaxID=3154409 RepID=UPI00332B4322
MRQVISKGILTAAAATSILSLNGATASADSQADGGAAGSPGVLSGNLVQAPIDVPVNVCGNSVDVVGLLNPAFGNNCANVSDTDEPGDAASGSSATGGTADSPGVGSGNTIQAPVHVPVNACGNSVDVIGALNPAFGNTCVNGDAELPEPPTGPQTPPEPQSPPEPETPTVPGMPNVPETPTVPGVPTQPTPEPPVIANPPVPTDEGRTITPAAPAPQLAETGFQGEMLAASAAAAGLLIGGGVLYRRGRAAARR